MYSWFPQRRWTGTGMEHGLSACLMSAAHAKSSWCKNCHHWVPLPLEIYHEQAVWGHISSRPGTCKAVKLSISQTSSGQQICLSREGLAPPAWRHWETTDKWTKKQRWWRWFWEKSARGVREVLVEVPSQSTSEQNESMRVFLHAWTWSSPEESHKTTSLSGSWLHPWQSAPSWEMRPIITQPGLAQAGSKPVAHETGRPFSNRFISFPSVWYSPAWPRVLPWVPTETHASRDRGWSPSSFRGDGKLGLTSAAV